MNNYGWICPKCERVLAPSVCQCEACNMRAPITPAQPEPTAPPIALPYPNGTAHDWMKPPWIITVGVTDTVGYIETYNVKVSP